MNHLMQRNALGQLLPGHSGNPGGRPKAVAEVRQLAQVHAAAAIKRLSELMLSNNEATALAAANALLDRGFGKPMQAIESKVEKVDWSAMFLDATKRVNEQARVAEDAKVIENKPARADETEW